MDRAPVLLLHGFGTSSARTWGDNGWIDLLSDAGRRVLAPDLLGHGDAPKPHDPEVYEGMEQAILDTVHAAVGDTPVDAVGFSLGARILLTLAGDHASQFSRLVVAGVGANLFSAPTFGRGEDLAAAFESPELPEDPVLAYFHRLAHDGANDPRALAASMRREVAPLDADRLAAITCPVLVALGDRDFAGPADPLLERLVNAPTTLVTLRGTDHFATPKSMAFLDAALDFLAAAP